MSNFKLKHPLTAVANGTVLTYGGSQLLSSNKTVRDCGCGIAAAFELFVYMQRHKEGCRSPLFGPLPPGQSLSREVYDRMLDKLRPYFPLIPRFGINGVLLAAGINLFFLRNGYPYKASWGLSSRTMWAKIAEMLDNELPVIISVGPNLPRFWQKNKADMYSPDSEGNMRKAASVNAHYMVLTELDDRWMTLSSWGRKYYISRSEYMEYIRLHSSGLVSNIVYIQKK